MVHAKADLAESRLLAKSNFQEGGAKLPLCRYDRQVVAHPSEITFGNGYSTSIGLSKWGCITRKRGVAILRKFNSCEPFAAVGSPHVNNDLRR